MTTLRIMYHTVLAVGWLSIAINFAGNLLFGWALLPNVAFAGGVAALFVASYYIRQAFQLGRV